MTARAPCPPAAEGCAGLLALPGILAGLAVLLVAAACACLDRYDANRIRDDDRGGAAPPARHYAHLADFTTTGGRYDGAAIWREEEAAIVGREGEHHAGGLLYTQETYRDAEIELDCWITHPFDSGIFFRMTPEAKGAQVTLDYRPGGEIAGIYADGWWLHNPAVKALWKRDAWNHVRARCVGDPMHLTVWLEGREVCDYRFPEDAQGFATTGLIGLQVHGGSRAPPDAKVMFRNVRVTDLAARQPGRYFTRGPSGGKELTATGWKAGWRPLFDGGSLDAWEKAGDGTGYLVEDGLLALLYEGRSPHLASKEDFRDVHLLLDFKTAKMANSGVFLRADRAGGNPAFSGCEVQILDDANWEAVTRTTLKPWQFSGSLYGAVAPRAKALRPVGTWNTLEVLYRGSRLVTALNGVVLYDVDTHDLDEAQPPFAERAATGFIGLQRHAPGGARTGRAYAWFRNVFIRRLAPPADGAAAPPPR